jgi:hypothetical protein
MASDPLRALARLRRLETDAAKRRLGEAFGRLATAEAREDAAAGALRREAAAGGPADYGLWLRRGLAEQDRAALARGFAESAAATARALLAEARAAGVGWKRCGKRGGRRRPGWPGAANRRRWTMRPRAAARLDRCYMPSARR